VKRQCQCICGSTSASARGDKNCLFQR